MSHNPQTDSSEHTEALLLLPWYVNKTLHKNEMLLVEKHLKSCFLCKMEIPNLQKLSTVIHQEELLAPAAAARTSFLQLKNRIHNNQASAKQKTAVIPTMLAIRLWFSSFSEKNGGVAYPSIALASLLLLTFSLILPAFQAKNQHNGNVFHTLSSSTLNSYPQNEIRLIFSSETTQSEMIQILSSVQGQIVAGPTDKGLYKIQIERETIPNIAKTISLLRNNKQIIFAEPGKALALINN